MYCSQGSREVASSHLCDIAKSVAPDVKIHELENLLPKRSEAKVEHVNGDPQSEGFVGLPLSL
jgi:hypothetical protein